VWRVQAHADFKPLAEVQRSARELVATLKASRNVGPRDGARDEETRRDFLERQLRALVTRIDVLTGVRRPFAEESRLMFDVEAPAPDRTRTEAARAALDRIVPGHGDLTRRIAELQRRFVVPPERLSAVFARALAECRAVTLHHIALPADERVEVEYAADSPWTAFTRYLGDHRSRITVNSAIAFTMDEVLDLACHEGYPGHHVIGILVDDALVRRRDRGELAVQPLFSPQAVLAEGAASVAPRLAFPDADRLRFERSALAEAAGVEPRDLDIAIDVERLLDAFSSLRADIAGRYVDGTLEFARAAAALEHEALMPIPDPLLKFVNEFRSYAVAYARGPELASAYLDAHGGSLHAEARWQAYVQLVTIPEQAFPQK